MRCSKPCVGTVVGQGLLDDLIRPEKERLRDREAKGLRRPEINHHLEPRRLLHGQVAWLGPFEDLIHVGGGASYLVVKVHRIRHEAASLHKLPMAPHRWYPTLSGEVHDGFSVLKGQNTRSPEQRVGALPGHRAKGALEVARSSHLERLQC